jgi:hypothetical protein
MDSREEWQVRLREECADYLVEKVRAMKGGVKGRTHHFTLHKDEPTLFRFERSSRT